MNKIERDRILELSNQYTDELVNSLIKAMYSDESNLHDIDLSHLTLIEFISLTKQVFTQFNSSFLNNAYVLPISYTHPQLGISTVEARLQTFFVSVSAESYDIITAEQSILWLALYQIEFGFFSRDSEKYNDSLLEEESKLTARLSLLQQNTENLQKEITDTLRAKKEEIEHVIADLNTSKADITSLIEQKRDELNQIAISLTTSNSQSNIISELVTTASEKTTRINTLLEEQEKNKLRFDKIVAETEQTYNDINNQLNENIKTTKELISDFKRQVEINNNHIEFIEGKRAFFDERNSYLENLIGREVGASLFETFKQRKNELNPSVKFWTWSVPVMSFLTIIWIVFIFRNQPSGEAVSTWWQHFALNSVKCIPAIFLLLFTISQYRRERNFQEEYAFKSAVALTINAYAGILSDLKEKDKLIIEAVLGVYKTPIEEKQVKARSKKMLDTINVMAETTKGLLNKD